MKKMILTALFAVVGVLSINAQEGQLNAGVNLGLPTGDASDGYTFSLGVEVNYLFEISDEFKVGPSAGYLTFLGDTVAGFDVENASFIPLAAAARYNASEKFVVGADLGYALGMAPDANDGGFYYRPMVGYTISEKMMIQATYTGVSVENSTFSAFGLGAMFAF